MQLFESKRIPTYHCANCGRRMGEHIPTHYGLLLMGAYGLVEPPISLWRCPTSNDTSQSAQDPPPVTPSPCECRTTYGKPLFEGQLHDPTCELRQVTLPIQTQPIQPCYQARTGCSKEGTIDVDTVFGSVYTCTDHFDETLP